MNSSGPHRTAAWLILVLFMLPMASNAAATSHTQILSIHFVGCGPPEGFHGYLARGAAQAGRDLGVEVRYRWPATLTPATQVAEMEAAIEAGANAIAVCAFSYDRAYDVVIARARKLGIPVASAAGPPPGHSVAIEQDKFLFRVGSDEVEAGLVVGRRLLALDFVGGTVIGNAQPADETCVDRAQSLRSVLRASGRAAEIIHLEQDIQSQVASVLEYLRRVPRTRAGVTVCSSTHALLLAREQAERPDMIIAGFDLDEHAITAIASGEQLFAVDQQPFWRGYMPVLLLTHYLRYGLLQYNAFLTGPSVVDAQTIEQVTDLVRRGYR